MTRGWLLPLLLLLVGTGCSPSRFVRLQMGNDVILVTPHEEDGAELEDSAVEDEEFQMALVELARDVRPFTHPLREARALYGVPRRGGVYWYEDRERRLVPLREGEDADGPRLLSSYADDALTQAYGRWCERRHQAGDCLRLLDEGPLLASDGRYSLAMAIAMDSVWDETAEALEGLADPVALRATLSASVTMYLLLWSMPEPLSKGVAATMTALAIAYLGVDTVWRLIDGWLTLVREVDRATTFEQLSEAGEAYSEVLGENAARVFVMLATAALGSTAGLSAKAPGLPGSAQAALVVESQAGYAYASIGSVESVAMTAEGFTVALAPHSLAMATRGAKGRRAHDHHLATDKNSISQARGGPWTPRFRKIFKKAGMELKDPENIVPVEGHQGPHPQRYHELVFGELDAATAHCRRVRECRAALEAALKRLAREVTTSGTELNLLVTQGATP